MEIACFFTGFLAVAELQLVEEIHELCEWNAKSLEQSRLLEDPVNHLQAEKPQSRGYNDP